MSTTFNWPDYSQQPVHSNQQCSFQQSNHHDTSNNNNHTTSVNNVYSYHPTSPMESRDYNNQAISPGVTSTPPRSSPSPADVVSDPFGQMVLHDTSPPMPGQSAYTNYQMNGQYITTTTAASSNQSSPMVVSPDGKQNPFPVQPSYNNTNYNNSSNSNANTMPLSPPISPLWTPASPTASPPSNPFDMFAPTAMPSQPPPPIPQSQPPTVTTSPSNVDDEASFWADMGFGVTTNDDNADANSTASSTPSTDAFTFDPTTTTSSSSEPIKLDSNSLPLGGEYYKARVTTPLIGAIFSSGSELRTTLYSSADSRFVDLVGNRPVISFTIDGGAADTAGICPGHILLSVNGQSVYDVDTAIRLVGSAPRPLVMEYYIPKNVEVIKTEGQCMVKYDTVGTEAPSSSMEWKGKYVVVGDMLAEPNVIHMYRSKVR